MKHPDAIALMRRAEHHLDRVDEINAIVQAHLRSGGSDDEPKMRKLMEESLSLLDFNIPVCISRARELERSQD